MKKPLKIGNAQGFWGDRPGAAAQLLSQQPNLDYITLDYLSEVSLSIMAVQQEKDPELGYARDFIDVIKSLVPFWQSGSRCKIITNAGGLNPQGLAEICQELLCASGCQQRIGVVSGDDVLPLMLSDLNEPLYNNLDTEEPLTTIVKELTTANAYLGAQPIVDALKQGADIVITGRIADPSLTVGPCVYHYGWSFHDYDLIAGATVAGHLIECGTQVTGGVSTHWMDVPEPASMGFPFVEMFSDGTFIITKPEASGGIVNRESVTEQLLYEIGDPDHYLSPDATVSFSSIQLKAESKNRVLVSGAAGKAPPDTLKVSATYKDGWKAEGFLAIFGPQAAKKAERCGQMVFKRVQESGFSLERFRIECLGAMDVVPKVFPKVEVQECILRLAAADHRLAALEAFSKEIAPLITSGPQGITGYVSGRPHIRSIFGYWPCLIEKDLVVPQVSIL